MATKTRRQKQKAKKREWGGRWADERKAGIDWTTLTLPEGVQFFAPDKAGMRRLDIIPYVVGKGNPYADEGFLHYERTFYVHRGVVGPNNQSYVCPNKVGNKRCPICEYRMALEKSGDATKELLSSLMPKERQLWNVIDLGDSEAGVQIWEVSYHLFGKMLQNQLELLKAEGEDYSDFADPENGYTLRIGFQEDSFQGRSYIKPVSIEFRPRKEQYEESIVDDATNLDDIIKVPSYDELKAAFSQEEDDEAPASVATDDEELEEAEDEWEEDEDEELDESEDDEEESEDDETEEDEDEEEESDDDDSGSADDWFDEEEDESEDEESEDESEEDEDDDDWFSDDEDEEEEEPPKKPPVKKKTTKKKTSKKPPTKKPTTKKKSSGKKTAKKKSKRR